jgi:hypothetical protein
MQSRWSKNADVAFQDCEVGDFVAVGYQQIQCHVIVDAKVVGLKRKPRYGAGGYET